MASLSNRWDLQNCSISYGGSFIIKPFWVDILFGHVSIYKLTGGDDDVHIVDDDGVHKFRHDVHKFVSLVLLDCIQALLQCVGWLVHEGLYTDMLVGQSYSYCIWEFFHFGVPSAGMVCLEITYLCY
nr:hypothetical protein CFP56_19810 [Quercus suber]